MKEKKLKIKTSNPGSRGPVSFLTTGGEEKKY
jgi:hypothetical protein